LDSEDGLGPLEQTITGHQPAKQTRQEPGLPLLPSRQGGEKLLLAGRPVRGRPARTRRTQQEPHSAGSLHLVGELGQRLAGRPCRGPVTAGRKGREWTGSADDFIGRRVGAIKARQARRGRHHAPPAEVARRTSGGGPLRRNGRPRASVQPRGWTPTGSAGRPSSRGISRAGGPRVAFRWERGKPPVDREGRRSGDALIDSTLGRGVLEGAQVFEFFFFLAGPKNLLLSVAWHDTDDLEKQGTALVTRVQRAKIGRGGGLAVRGEEAHVIVFRPRDPTARGTGGWVCSAPNFRGAGGQAGLRGGTRTWAARRRAGR